MFCTLPWLDSLEESRYAFVSGSLFALDLAGLPFADPVGALQVAAGGFVPGLRQLLGALLTLALAFFMGRVFCSWICPYGFFSELVHDLRRRFFGKPELEKLDKKKQARTFALKGGIVLIGLAAAAVLGWPVLNTIAMPGELSLAPLHFWKAAGLTVTLVLMVIGLPLAILAVEFATGKRLWCRYVCPQSVLLGLSARLFPRSAKGLRIGWQAARCSCGKDAPCRAVCSLGLNPRTMEGPERRDCTMCGDCVKACASKGGALRMVCATAPAPAKKK
ncbi:MAG: 4Fe-4S binding protein [Mailhella sp.]|nr:4Fe-4S binding protein [Mailhella sp.]